MPKNSSGGPVFRGCGSRSDEPVGLRPAPWETRELRVFPLVNSFSLHLHGGMW